MPSSLSPHEHELEGLLRGSAPYVANVRPPECLHAAIVRSPEAHGRLLEVRAADARRLSGIHAVLTATDLDPLPHIPIRSFPQPGMEHALQPVLAYDRVRYVGEPVALVVADDRYRAEDASDLVELVIDPLPPVLDVVGPPAARLFDPLSDNVLSRWHAATGDVEAAFAAADVVIEQRFTTQRHTGIPIEPRGIVASWLSGEALHVWGPTKFLAFTRRTLAEWFSLDPDRVVCHRVAVGGMFGVRGELYPEDFLVPWAAKVVGRPVTWIEDRREHLLSINHSRELTADVRVAVAGNGDLLAFDASLSLDVGAYVRPLGGRLALLAIEEMPGPYRWPAFAATSEGIATTKTPCGTVRGPVALEATFARERVIDMAAARLGLDPVDVRRRNLISPAELPFTRAFGSGLHDHVYDSGDFPAFLETLCRRARLEQRRAEARERKRAGELVGVGVALFLAHSGLGSVEAARVVIESGLVTALTAAADVGQGLDASARRVVSSALKVEPSRVTVTSGALDAEVPPSAGTFSSRTAMFVASALHDACTKLVAGARRALAERHGLPPAQIRHVHGGFDAGGRFVGWDGLPRAAETGEHRSEMPAFGFGGHVAVVRVDAASGAVTIEDLVVGYDCGRALDPQTVHDQLRGGAVQGVGSTIFEELVYDESGQLLTTSFMDYLVPTCAEAPPVRIELFEAPTVTNPLGVKGSGEAGVIGVAGAVANAVGDALDAVDAIASLPLHHGRLLASVQAGDP